jgi:hypothetical protein
MMNRVYLRRGLGLLLMVTLAFAGAFYLPLRAFPNDPILLFPGCCLTR